MGMVAGLIYLVTMFLFIPFPFMKWFTASNDGDLHELKLLTFPNLKVRQNFCSYLHPSVSPSFIVTLELTVYIFLPLH